jgi:predicted GIY-YIG superfamily endonuclease
MIENTKKYYCYWIVSGRCNYIGATVDPKKRLRQHNSILKGGARRTRGKLWHFHCLISGFRTWREALCYEWSLKYHSRHCRGIESRQLALEKLMLKERWTSNSPLASEVPLTYQYSPTEYGMPPDKLPSPKINKTHTTKSTEKKKKRRVYKKKLHGVTY